MRALQIVMGPAGSGKSTYCKNLQDYCAQLGRTVHVINLDPAAENFLYDVALDIRDLISLGDVVEELEYGPNGGLVYCMEYLVENIEWLQDSLNEFHEEDYIIFDCPGQIELYTHYSVMTTIVKQLKMMNFSICGLYLIDSSFCQDSTKFLSASLTAMSTMVMLEIPHLNVLTKCDLIHNWRKRRDIEMYTEMDILSMLASIRDSTPKRFKSLTKAIGALMEEWNMVGFIPLDPQDDESMEILLLQIDNSIQYGEDLEVKTRDFNEKDENNYEDEETGYEEH
eukprot:c2606_g1_i1.p1 GENE.c2606_g1_i1~~c2606_g1_i1.p1  ORF type:complete len:293 (+),score=90.47 c2606_g1_i1:36-881(+)